MQDVRANLYPCAHCSGTGTCKSGINEHSCNVCIKINELKGTSFKGLPCSVCGGIGQAEPKTERINKRMPALLGMIVVFLLLALIFISLSMDSKYFTEVLTFSSTIIGSALGYYYSSKVTTKP